MHTHGLIYLSACMRLLLALSLYLVAVAALGATAATLYAAVRQGGVPAAARQEASVTASPSTPVGSTGKPKPSRLSGKPTAAGLPLTELSETRRASLAATPEAYATPQSLEPPQTVAPDRERVAPARETRREVRRQLRHREARQAISGYAMKPRRAADEFQTRRDRDPR